MAPNDFAQRDTLYDPSRVLPGNGFSSASYAGVYSLNEEFTPTDFPMLLWNAQSARYQAYWDWFTGRAMAQEGKDAEGNIIQRWPLQINTIRNITRKHAAMLWGEFPDTPTPLARASFLPRPPMDGGKFTADDEKNAKLCENIVNSVWMQSEGRALQYEHSVLAQFLGGAVFQVCYEPWHSDEWDIPISIRAWPADYFLPVWTFGKYWDLDQAWIITRIESAIAKTVYDVDVDDDSPYAIYAEHWTKNSYSILINREPIRNIVAGEEVLYKDLQNPFGFVPFVYIPHVREGNFFGSSHVPDLIGLNNEYNERLADMGDAIGDAIARKRYLTNASNQIKRRRLPDGTDVIDLGHQSPTAKEPPKVAVEDAPRIYDSVANFPDDLWEQILREAQLSGISFGEDEGSQRSALTLAFRMWPSTAHAREERGFWETGLNKIATMILKMVNYHQMWESVTERKIPSDYLKRMEINHAWAPMMPRDRESLVNEVILRVTSNLMSPQTALEMLGDVRNTDNELKLIKEWMVYTSSLGGQQQQDGEATVSEGTVSPKPQLDPNGVNL